MCIMRSIQLSCLLLLLATAATCTHAEPVARWTFDAFDEAESAAQPETASGTSRFRDDISGVSDRVIGYHRLANGVAGRALRLGGIGSYLERTSAAVPRLDGAFSIEAWIAIGAYPVNWCPIVGQADNQQGILFGIDGAGHLGLQLGSDGQWQTVASEERIGLGEWMHIAFTFDSGQTATLYLNGKPVATADLPHEPHVAADQPMLIGMNPINQRPQGTLRDETTGAVNAHFDGLLDEIAIYDRALSAAEVATAHERLQAGSADLPSRVLPIGPAGTGEFGAFYTKLSYYDAWDAQWRVGADADVVVRFDKSPCRFVFWRGTSYVPNWVTENGIWYNNEFTETSGAHGCYEPMSDKQCRHSQVRILESNDARVVVHWRYASIDNLYKFAHVDELTGLGDWTDEVHTVYPDGVGVREITLHSTDVDAWHEWHESILIMGPGQRPEQVLQPEAVTLLNPQGESHTYSWAQGVPKLSKLPAGANIQIVNTKSKYKPFFAVSSRSAPTILPYQGDLRPEVSIFPWWNHWPTAFGPSDGRYALDADRASHSSQTNCTWNEYRRTANSLTKIMLTGLSNGTPEEVVRLTRSWDSPPQLSVIEGEYSSDGYDPCQRAYQLSRTGDVAGDKLTLRIDASDSSPISNLAIVVPSWGNRGAAVKVDEKEAAARVGHRSSLEGRDLIIWLECESTSPISITITAN